MPDLPGALLLRSGRLRECDVAAATALQEQGGGSFGECLVQLGLIDEESLADFYQSHLKISRVPDERLTRVSQRALQLVSADMAAEFRVVPVELDSDGYLVLAMADPTDNHAVDEVAFFADRFVVRVVATESAIRAALDRHYGVRFSPSAPLSSGITPNTTPPIAVEPSPPVQEMAAAEAPRTPAPAEVSPIAAQAEAPCATTADPSMTARAEAPMVPAPAVTPMAASAEVPPIAAQAEAPCATAADAANMAPATSATAPAGTAMAAASADAPLATAAVANLDAASTAMPVAASADAPLATAADAPFATASTAPLMAPASAGAPFATAADAPFATAPGSAISPALEPKHPSDGPDPSANWEQAEEPTTSPLPTAAPASVPLASPAPPASGFGSALSGSGFIEPAAPRIFDSSTATPLRVAEAALPAPMGSPRIAAGAPLRSVPALAATGPAAALAVAAAPLVSIAPAAEPRLARAPLAATAPAAQPAVLTAPAVLATPPAVLATEPLPAALATQPAVEAEVSVGVEEPVYLLTQVKYTATAAPQPMRPATDTRVPLTTPRAAAPEWMHLTPRGDEKLPPDPPLLQLRTAAERDAIATTVLDYLHQLAHRVLFLVMKRGFLCGHDARGLTLDREGVRQLAFDSTMPNLLQDVVTARLPYRGPMPPDREDGGLAQALGGVGPEVLVMPILVRDRVLAVVFADGATQPLPDAALHATIREAGLAYERLILTTKRG